MNLKNQTIRHDLTGNTWEAWCDTAEDLLAAARVLKVCADTFDPSVWDGTGPYPDAARVPRVLHMLQGMAMENLLKALWLKKGNKLVSSGKLDKQFRSHGLDGLANDVGFAVSAEEGHLLTRLSEFVMHGGRYPIPVRAADYLKMIPHPRGGSGQLTTWSSSDNARFDALVARLHIELGWSPS